MTNVDETDWRATLEPMGGFLRCGQCGRREPLGDTAAHTARGWPKCCGYTMTWWTQRQIDAGEAPDPNAEGGRHE